MAKFAAVLGIVLLAAGCGKTPSEKLTALSEEFVYTSLAYSPSAATAAGLVINPTFDDSITNSPNAAAIESMVSRAIALYQPPPFTRSGFERRFFDAVLRAGLPRPATNFVEAGFELDVYWPQYRFAVELDVYATHGTIGAFERDRLRQEDLKVAGIEMTRVTDVRFHRESRAVLARVTRLLEDRRRELRQPEAPE